MNTIDPILTSQTRIIEKSPPYGIPPVVVHPSLDPELKERLREIFLNLHRNVRAMSLLGQLQIDRFEEGDDAIYDSVRDMQKWLGERIKK
jgi:phosphonate transport system substrate-binding protein